MRPVGAGFDHVQRGYPLGMAAGLGQAGIDKQAVAVLHQAVPHEAELGLLALAFPVEPGVQVGRRCMRLIGALLAMEVCLCIAATATGRRSTRTTRLAILRLDALHRRPGFDQRAVDGEVVGGQEPLDPGLRQDRAEELRGDVAFEQPVPVLRKYRMVPSRIVDANPDEPAEQEVVFQALHQQPFRADGIESLQQHRTQQLRRDRRSPDRRIERSKLLFQRSKRLFNDQPDRPQRMIPPDPIFQNDIAEEFTVLRSLPRIPSSPKPVEPSESWEGGRSEWLFQQPARKCATGP
jgi:hypothetical protein